MSDDVDHAEPLESAAPPALTRPDGCKAYAHDGLARCDRCGLRWDLTDPDAPACEPMTFKRMRDRLEAEISSAETSAEICAGLRARGMPADPRHAHKRHAELEAILRVYDRATATPAGRAFLNGDKAPA